MACKCSDTTNTKTEKPSMTCKMQPKKKSSPITVLARSRTLAGIYLSTPLPQSSSLCRVNLKGTEDRCYQPSPPSMEETGRGQAMPASLDKQEWSCPMPTSTSPMSSQPPSAPHIPQDLGSLSPSAAACEKCPHPILGNGFTPIPSCLTPFRGSWLSLSSDQPCPGCFPCLSAVQDVFIMCGLST